MTDNAWRGRGVLILGAASAIAEATARELASEGASLALVARDAARLEAMAADLRVRGAPSVAIRSLDLLETEPTDDLLQGMADEIGGFDTALIAHGVLGEQERAEQDSAAAAALIDVNFTSAALWALALARFLERTRGPNGVVAAIGSVAGDRGRSSNYVYGAAKAGLAVLMQGIAHRHAQRGGPKAVVYKLGFVDTPMTAGMAKGGPLWASPQQVAKVIVKGLNGRSAIVYGPWFWRYVMLIIRLLPQGVIAKINF
jgi:decaprenylphospho-beta-D-erythro-pentofuranosid-2-ulose 2-reductase